MAFSQALTNDPKRTGSGQLIGQDHICLNFSDFANDLFIGRFAKFDEVTEELQPLDASATPTIAGVITRSPTQTLDTNPDSTIDERSQNQVTVCRTRLITVEVVNGDTPAKFGQVFVKNTNDADAGKATTVNDATTVEVNAEFIEEYSSNVWLILLVGKL